MERFDPVSAHLAITGAQIWHRGEDGVTGANFMEKVAEVVRIPYDPGAMNP